MKLPALALFERSLRLETRSGLMCWARFGLLGVVLLVLFPLQTMARVGWFGAPGLHFLQEMVWVNLVFITLAGVSYFASAITEEKEEMMLGLLRMTDLNPIAILLGKSTSRLVGGILFLLIQVPFILLAVTLGGVGPVQVIAACATLLAYLFLVCNLALLCSVIFPNTTMAAAFTLAALLVFLFGHYWAGFLLHDVLGLRLAGWPIPGGWLQLWNLATPTNRILVIFLSGFAGPAVGWQVISNLVLGVLAFLLAWLAFDRFTRQERDPVPAPRWLIGRPTRASRIPADLTGTWALTWKDFIFISGGKFGLLARFGVVALALALVNLLALESGSRGVLTREFEGACLIWISILVTAVCLAVDAGRIFREEVRWKTLSALVLLPISIPQLAYRKVAGALAGTLPLLAGALFGAMMVPDDVGRFIRDVLSESDIFGVLLVAILQYLLFLHLVAFLSLVVKRGALPLAIGIQYLGGSFLVSFVAMTVRGSGVGVLFLIGFGCAVGTIVLHRAIGLRLMSAAAQE